MIGLIAEKVGMTQVFDENGVLTPVTVVKVDENTVVGERTAEKKLVHKKYLFLFSD